MKFIFLFFAFPVWAACPQQGMTNTQLMHGLGRALLGADLVSTLDDAELTRAIAGVDEALECVDLAVDCGAALLPRKMGDPVYTSRYFDFLGAFRARLVEYGDLFRAELERPPHQRNITEIAAKRRALRDLANAAHAGL